MVPASQDEQAIATPDPKARLPARSRRSRCRASPPIRKPIRLAALVGLCLSLIAENTGADPPLPLKAKPLLPLVGPKEQVDAWKVQLCARPEVGCTKADLTLYRAADDEI